MTRKVWGTVGAAVMAAAALVSCGSGARSAPPATATTTSAFTPGTAAPPTTAVAPAGDVISGFIAFGDFGGGPAQDAVAAQMQTWAAGHRVDALVTVGDNVYPSGESSLFDAQLDRPYRELRATRPLWATLGNHDVVAADRGRAQLAHLGLPPLPFARSLPGVQLLFLDANRPDEAQAAWLDARLAEPGPRLRVVSFHQPAWSCGLHGSTEAVDQFWVPVLERHRVALVLNGHDHHYQRFLSDAGVTYIVTGGGGQPVYPMFRGCAAGAREITAEAVHHFTAVEVHDHALAITAVAVDGRVIDQAVVTR